MDCIAGLRAAPMVHGRGKRIFVQLEVRENIRASNAQSFREGHTGIPVRRRRRGIVRRVAQRWRTAKSSLRNHPRLRQAERADRIEEPRHTKEQIADR